MSLTLVDFFAHFVIKKMCPSNYRRSCNSARSRMTRFGLFWTTITKLDSLHKTSLHKTRHLLENCLFTAAPTGLHPTKDSKHGIFKLAFKFVHSRHSSSTLDYTIDVQIVHKKGEKTMSTNLVITWYQIKLNLQQSPGLEKNSNKIFYGVFGIVNYYRHMSGRYIIKTPSRRLGSGQNECRMICYLAKLSAWWLHL